MSHPLTEHEVKEGVAQVRLREANEFLSQAYRYLARWDEEWFDRTRALLEEQGIDVADGS